ncbi:Ankyrin repeat family protein [Prunus dulcis]|uniref:Ankyrin repeat family protein n=1 Tax=Prunus dulcis TaxID=3755 RepID=A0A4Y1QXF1_PRUDU|nr:Ankyrin repeat family protein [Prunus dulcis]
MHDIALDLLQRCPRLAITKGPMGESPIFVLADIPSVFRVGSRSNSGNVSCDNNSAIDIAHNPVQHDWTKHVETDSFFIKEKIKKRLADVLTKAVSKRVFHNSVTKLGILAMCMHQLGSVDVGTDRTVAIFIGHIGHPPAIPDVSVNVQNPEIELGSQRNISFSGAFFYPPQPFSGCNIFFDINIGINHICEMKLIHDRTLYILDHMLNKAVKDVDIQEREDGLVYEAVFQAVRRGIIEFVIRLCKIDPDVLWRNNSMGRNIFHYSIECRQEKVYSLIYGVRQRNLIATFSDAFGNDMLHLAGMLSPTEKLDRISGAALQMQRERQWFKNYFP